MKFVLFMSFVLFATQVLATEVIPEGRRLGSGASINWCFDLTDSATLLQLDKELILDRKIIDSQGELLQICTERFQGISDMFAISEQKNAALTASIEKLRVFVAERLDQHRAELAKMQEKQARQEYILYGVATVAALVFGKYVAMKW